MTAVEQRRPPHPLSHLRAAMAPAPDAERTPLSVILKKAGKRALGGGVPGAVAMGAQVVTLMPLRTTMNVRRAHRLGAARSRLLRPRRTADRLCFAPPWRRSLRHALAACAFSRRAVP